MRIGFDFDKIFVNFPPFVPDFIIEYLYKKKNHVLAYRFPPLWEQKLRIFSHYPLLRLPITNNINALSAIGKKGGVELFLISGRFGFLKDRTRDWLAKHPMQGYFKDMYFNFGNEQPHVFKDRILHQLKIGQYIDDDLDLLRYLAEHNPDIRFYWLTDKKRAGHGQESHNIAPIHNLEEFLSRYL